MTARIIPMVLLLGVLGVPGAGALVAVEGDDPVAAAEAAAKTNAGTPAGMKYQQSIEQAFGRDHAATVGKCANSIKRPQLVDFDLFLRVDAGGALGEILVAPKTNLSVCVQDRLRGWKVPDPPEAGFWVKIAVNLQVKK